MRSSRIARHPRRWLALMLVALTVSAGGSILAGAHPAAAETRTTTLVYRGSNDDRIQILDTGLQHVAAGFLVDAAQAWFRIRAGVHTTVLTAQSADLTLDAPDSFRADSASSLSTTLKAVDAAGKEVTLKTAPYVDVDVAWDGWPPPANCDDDVITSAEQLETWTDTSGCVDGVAHPRNVELGTFTLLDKDTTLPYAGTKTVDQTVQGPSIEIVHDILGLHLEFATQLALAATGGYTADRLISTSGAPDNVLSSGTVRWSNANPLPELVTLPCNAPVGDNLVYKLANNRWTGTAAATGTAKLVVELAVLPDPTFSIATVPLFNAPILAAADAYSQTLGPVQAENKAPTAAVGTITGGNEGAPLPFSVVGTGTNGAFDNCDASGATTTFEWQFDDGAQAFGKEVFHVFADNNGVSPHSGHVRVTDKSGNATDLDFAVAVANAAPVVDAGPDTSSAWGVPVALNGTATDPGSADQGTLKYSWDFGDGSPSATGGPSVTHSYNGPGDYKATLTVCDKDGACSSDDTVVHVRKRGVSLGYTGDHGGTYDTPATLAASLTDELGQPVAGRSISFAIGSEAAGRASTDATGRAALSHIVGLGQGTYAAGASFDGDTLYERATGGVDFSVSRKATNVSYTGPLSASPNKTMTLSGVLTDSQGKPLGGRQVAFQLGSQKASATTDGNGVATATLRLDQKNGSYSLTTTFTPSGPDESRYAGASDSDTFKLQVK